MPAANFDDELDAVFDLVAEQTRLDILRALWEEWALQRESTRDPVPFSTLREAVGVEDSGRFNYHLDKLIPYFVRNEDEGYALTYAGAQVIGAAVSGIYTDTDTALEPTALGACSSASCAGTVHAEYEAGTVAVDCDTCDVTTKLSAPPILVGAHDLAGDPDVLARFALTVIQKTVRGFCHVCSGPVEQRVVPDGPDVGNADQVTVAHECRECGSVSHTSAVSLLIDHPGVIAAFHEADIDYRNALLWTGSETFDWSETLQDDGTIEVEIAFEDEELFVVLDERLEVRESTRR